LAHLPDAVWGTRSLDLINGIVVHHSAIKQPVTAERLAQAFVNKRWPTIPYHFYIEQSGRLTWCLSLEEAGGHCDWHEDHTIGICLAGRFLAGQAPTQEQLTVLEGLIAELRREFPGIKYIWGHKELRATACPGEGWLEMWRDLFVNPWTAAPGLVEGIQGSLEEVLERVKRLSEIIGGRG